MSDKIGAPGPTLVTNQSHALVASGASGKLLCVRQSDKRVLSIQPNGTQDYREPGVDGPFEQCELVGETLKYDYVWEATGLRYIHKVAWTTSVD